MTVREDNRKLIRRNNDGKLEGDRKKRSGKTITKKIGDGTVGENDTSDIDSELGKENKSDKQERGIMEQCLLNDF